MFKILFFWMNYLKKLQTLILRSWLGPFLISFSVILFILVLQFLTKYKDELFGKGLESDVIATVFVYACLTLVPLALPLGVLLSSLLTMGNLGERYELAAMKSSGIGLFQVMRPLTYITIAITLGAMAFSFYVVPVANLKLYTLLYDLGQVKPTFALKENHFYSDLDGLVIHCGDLNRETDVLYKIKIYDHTDKVGNNRITLADSGKMVPADATGYLQMSLYHGVIHEEIPKKPGDESVAQYQRFYFDSLEYRIAMSGFDLEESEGSIFAPHHFMKDIHDLYTSLDSMGGRLDNYKEDLIHYMGKYNHVDSAGNQAIREGAKADSAKYGADGKIVVLPDKPVWDWFPDADKENLVSKAVQQCRAVKNYTTIIQERLDRENLKIRKFKIEVNNRYSLPISCIVFLFLGAPLGAIIRKGGLGLPVIFSILFFIIFYILMIQGKKFARDEILPVWAGVWLPVLVMSPMAAVFTWSSATDSPILLKSSWHKLMNFLFGWLRLLGIGKEKAAPQTLSIEELVELREEQKRVARERLNKYQEELRKKKSGNKKGETGNDS